MITPRRPPRPSDVRCPSLTTEILADPRSLDRYSERVGDHRTGKQHHGTPDSARKRRAAAATADGRPRKLPLGGGLAAAGAMATVGTGRLRAGRVRGAGRGDGGRGGRRGASVDIPPAGVGPGVQPSGAPLGVLARSCRSPCPPSCPLLFPHPCARPSFSPQSNFFSLSSPLRRRCVSARRIPYAFLGRLKEEEYILKEVY